MKFASLTQRIAGNSADAWAVHNKAQQRVDQGESIIMLSIGQEGDEVTPKSIVNAAKESLDSGRHHYTHVDGDPTLKEAISKYHTRMTGQAVSANNCTVHSGAQNALYSVAQCILEPDDEVILSEPYYTTYPASFTASGATPVSVEVLAKDNFLVKPESVINAITKKTRAIVLNSPSNPLGTVYTREQYEPIVRACVDNNIWLINDNVYGALLEPEDRFSPATLPGADKVCVTISSLSKSHRMTGWRVGWMIGPTELAAHLKNLCLCMHYGLPTFIMDAAVQALNDESPAKTIRAAMKNRRTIVKESLDTGPNIAVSDSGVGMFVLLDVSATGLTAREFAEGLLDQHAVSTLPCDGFGPAGKTLIRVGLCVDGAQLRTACDRISRYSKSL